jgi:hypothetical protein
MTDEERRNLVEHLRELGGPTLLKVADEIERLAIYETALNKAQDRIARLEYRVSELERKRW